MAETAADVLVGATGKVYGGVTGTPLPVTAVASLNAAFHDLGYIGDTGVEQIIAETTVDIKAWGGSTIRTVQTAHTVTYKLTMIETNPNALAAYYKNVAGPIVQITADMDTRQSWVCDVVDGSNLVRVVIPDGQITVHDNVLFNTSAAIGYGITITAYPDLSNVKAYEYLSTAGVS